MTTVKTCAGCAFSGIEPEDMDLTCGHEKAGVFGKHVVRGPIAECGPTLVLFIQHPHRMLDGSLAEIAGGLDSKGAK